MIDVSLLDVSGYEYLADLKDSQHVPSLELVFYTAMFWRTALELKITPRQLTWNQIGHFKGLGHDLDDFSSYRECQEYLLVNPPAVNPDSGLMVIISPGMGGKTQFLETNYIKTFTVNEHNAICTSEITATAIAIAYAVVNHVPVAIDSMYESFVSVPGGFDQRGLSTGWPLWLNELNSLCSFLDIKILGVINTGYDRADTDELIWPDSRLKVRIEGRCKGWIDPTQRTYAYRGSSIFSFLSFNPNYSNSPMYEKVNNFSSEKQQALQKEKEIKALQEEHLKNLLASDLFFAARKDYDLAQIQWKKKELEGEIAAHTEFFQSLTLEEGLKKKCLAKLELDSLKLLQTLESISKEKEKEEVVRLSKQFYQLRGKVTEMRALYSVDLSKLAQYAGFDLTSKFFTTYEEVFSKISEMSPSSDIERVAIAEVLNDLMRRRQDFLSKRKGYDLQF